ncbi:rod shape-determining protein MreC [Patescibacteria group bacterium]|nr:rod shape-determining protein MreC [Patescibacteria group bacterium]
MTRIGDDKLTPLIISVSVVVALFVLHVVGVLRPVESFIVSTASPVQNFLFVKAQNISGSLSLIGSLKSVAEENTTLEKKVGELESEMAHLKEVERENELLRKQIGFAKNEPVETIPALVVGLDPTSLVQSLNVDKGVKDGVQIGRPVIDSSGAMLGKIVKADDRSSSVLLLTDSNSSVVGITQDSRATGVLNGEHGLALTMSTIPQDKDVKSGERVVTAGMEKGMPKGLLIGEIAEIKAHDNELFKEAKVSPLGDFKAIEMVFIVK